MGSSIVWKYAPDDNVFRHLFSGGVGSFVIGGPFFTAYAVAVNLYKGDLKRHHVVIGEVLAGVLNGVLTGAILFFLDVRRLGFETAFSFAVAWWIIPVVTGVCVGLSLNVQPVRSVPEPLSAHMAKAALWSLVGVIAGSSLIYFARSSLFYPVYLQRFEFIDVLADSIRISLVGFGLATLQWWLKWERRL